MQPRNWSSNISEGSKTLTTISFNRKNCIDYRPERTTWREPDAIKNKKELDYQEGEGRDKDKHERRRSL